MKNYITYLRERNTFEGLIINKNLTIQKRDRQIKLLQGKIDILHKSYITLATHLIHVEQKFEKLRGPQRVPIIRVKKFIPKLKIVKEKASKVEDPLKGYKIPKLKVSKSLWNTPATTPAPSKSSQA